MERRRARVAHLGEVAVDGIGGIIYSAREDVSSVIGALDKASGLTIDRLVLPQLDLLHYSRRLSGRRRQILAIVSYRPARVLEYAAGCPSAGC